MKLLRLQNKGGRKWWMASPSEKRAIKDSMSYGYAKTPKNIKIVADQTEHYLQKDNGTLKRVLEGRFSGTLCVKMPIGNWVLSPYHRTKL